MINTTMLIGGENYRDDHSHPIKLNDTRLGWSGISTPRLKLFFARYGGHITFNIIKKPNRNDKQLIVDRQADKHFIFAP